MVYLICELALLIGVGISIDLLFGTIANYNDKGLTFKTWSWPLAKWHIILFAGGAYILAPLVALGWTSIGSIAAISCVLIAILVVEIIIKACGWNPLPYGPSWIAGKLGIDEENANRTLSLIAFSLDALFVGLANTAIDFTMVLVAVLAGAVVFVFAQGALIVNTYLRYLKPKEGAWLTSFNMFGSFASTSAIATFGVIAFHRYRDGVADPSQSILTALLLVGIVYAIFHKMIWEESK